MGVFQRLGSLGFVPIVALLALQLFAPEMWHELHDILEPYLAGTAISHIFPHPLPPRSQTPILITATTQWSHVEKVAVIAMELATLGYPITFLTGRIFEKDVSNLHKNIKFVPYVGADDKLSDSDLAEYMAIPNGLEKEQFIMKKVLIDGMSIQHVSIQAELKSLRQKWGKDRPLISLFDQAATGNYPIIFGAPGLKADANIGISLAPLTLESNDTFPFRTGKVPHTGLNATEVHAKAYKEYYASYYVKDLNEAWWAKLRLMGAVQPSYPGIMEAMSLAPDHLLALGVPEFEFPRRDIRSNIQYIGALRKQGINSDHGEKEAMLPSWWSDIEKAKKEGKKIVAVSQGTVEGDLTDLVLPTIEALQDEENVLLIATTVLVDPKDVEDLVVPANTRVEKFVPYVLLLPLIDLLVSNGGNGAVQLCTSIGLPMVVSGVGQDKATTNAIIEWSGVGINLGVQRPTVAVIKSAVMKVLSHDEYKEKAVKLSKHYEDYDVGKVVDGLVRNVVKEWVKGRANESVEKEEL